MSVPLAEEDGAARIKRYQSKYFEEHAPGLLRKIELLNEMSGNALAPAFVEDMWAIWRSVDIPAIRVQQDIIPEGRQTLWETARGTLRITADKEGVSFKIKASSIDCYLYGVCYEDDVEGIAERSRPFSSLILLKGDQCVGTINKDNRFTPDQAIEVLSGCMADLGMIPPRNSADLSRVPAGILASLKK